MNAGRSARYSRRDRLRLLRAFASAARHGNMTRAAETLCLSQPAVSLQVRELEREFDTVLFERSGPRISLTPAGERLYELARPLVDGLDELPDRFAAELAEPSEAELRITSGDTGAVCALPGIVARVRGRYPGIRILLSSGHPDDGLKRLLAGEADLAFDAALPNVEEAVFEPVLSSDFVLIAPRTTCSPGARR